MHPILANRNHLRLYLAAWLPVIAMISVLLVMSGRLSWPDALALAVPLGILNAFMCLSAWYLCRSFPLQSTGIPRLFSVYAIASFLTSSLWVFLGKPWSVLIANVPMLSDLGDRYGEQVPLLFVIGILLFLLIVAVHYLLNSFETARQVERRALQNQILAREAELKALRAQIDPHFMFNCLNSISALTSTDPAKAREMCLMLADFLRMSLAIGNREFISMAEEIALATQFLAIEQVRLGPRLKFEKQISETAAECPIPPLLLQPLVENAVRHGIGQLLEGGTLRIEADRQGGRLFVAVENPYDPDARSSAGKGIGIKNVRQRLSTMFGNESSLNLNAAGNRYCVKMSFPALAAKERAGNPEANPK
jgi:hypothetical protein